MEGKGELRHSVEDTMTEVGVGGGDEGEERGEDWGRESSTVR